VTGPHRENPGPLADPSPLCNTPSRKPSGESAVRSRIAPEAGLREIATPNKHRQVPDQLGCSPPFIANDACSAVGATQPQ
jgi:hypothetical protein